MNKVLIFISVLFANCFAQFDSYILDVNNIKLPLNNNGWIADVSIYDSLGNNLTGGKFDNQTFLYSAGFGLSGYNKENLWANGVMSSARINDYLPGNIGGTDSSKFKIYSVTSKDSAFASNWQKWKDAVKLGAKFYDGNHNGIYDPIDLNENGKWDASEDMPDLLGDQTAWCVFNDSFLPEKRRFYMVKPQGIEIKQTVFAYSPNTHPELANVIFIRCNIENKGTVSDKFDSVYFSPWLDPDIGYYGDDLIGCDTTLNSLYAYDRGIDTEYGISPSFFSSILQGPVSYIPNITYLDNNKNDSYDIGIDFPIDTAKQFYGDKFFYEFFPGAKNLEMTTSIFTIHSHDILNDPFDEYEFRYYQLGRDRLNNIIDPCSFEFGNVFNQDCNKINSNFWFSGDPVTQNGWLCNFFQDQRSFSSTGPFQLIKGKPIEIIIAYVVGRGSTSLESINIARDITKDVIAFYNSNFKEIPVSVKNNKSEIIPSNFVLEQNYPNPFNPSTTIKYQIPNQVRDDNSSVIARSDATWQSNEITSGNSFPRNDNVNVKLIVYDILGREVATLVNQKQKPGNYEINFDASKYSSGVYYYQLKVGASTSSATSFMETKKMMLLK